MNTTKYSLLLVLLLFVNEAFTQGFNTTSGRNHPELNWQVAETEHFLIMYPERINGIQDKVAAISEETYTALSHNLDVEFDQKIRIYLSDEDEVNNGFAVPYSRPYTNIWVNLNDYSEIWTGEEKWLRKVVAHELAHIFHFQAVRSPIGLLQYLFANPLPSFWTEGLAQYETEVWDSQRGDRWLRKAIFDDDLNYNSGTSIEDGRLRYALGNAQVRYFTDTYGDTTLASMLAISEKSLGFIEYHDFNEAFSETIDGGYSSFFDEWRKHANIYYNTLAGQMERVDSLKGEEVTFPGDFYFDAAISPNDSLIAVYSLQSMSRPVRRLHIISNDSSQTSTFTTEGRIGADLHWVSDHKILYSRLVRGKDASLVNDIFEYDLSKKEETRITQNRRAKFPIKTSEKDEIAYIVNEDGTGNLFTKDLKNGKEQRVTNYTGDVQLLWPLWIENEHSFLVHKFDKSGDRNLVLIDPATQKEVVIDRSAIDNRKAILSPDGHKIAYQSLRDNVPNIFIYDLKSGKEHRVTNVFTGAEIFGWGTSSDSTKKEKLLVGASESRKKDHLFLINADRRVERDSIQIPSQYSAWISHRPPVEIPSQINTNKLLISDSYEYNSFKNISHVITLAFPYYSDENNWGLFATTNWTEPLNKHTISAGGLFSIPDPLNNSFGALSYINNQFYPSIAFNLYKSPDNGQFYGDEYLIEEYTGADISVRWPINAFEAPYQNSFWSARMRYYHTTPFAIDRFTDNNEIERPLEASVADIGFSWQLKKERPWKDNKIHPLDGYGLKFDLKASGKILGADVNAITTDLNAYTIQPGLGQHRFYVQGRFQSQWGNALPQNYIGFSRYDNISFMLPSEFPFSFFRNNERVRGYRDFVSGEHVAFGSLEYRIPLIPSLKTELLGVVRFGGVNAALFTDVGIVWNGSSESGKNGTIERWGTGYEFKNELSIFGISVNHAIGFAKKGTELLDENEFNVYYKVKASVPF
ncbi:MAG: BamA/TamA family outer membrane protein [Gracilimonas sp.]|nr:BamA/TamA family outer membrane protein [Gracilimonas sp.]